MHALKYAKAAHKGQRRKYTGVPYIHHPIRVASRVMMESWASQAAISAALLHDVIEDCGRTESMLRWAFKGWRGGDEAVDIVVGLTNPSKQYKDLPRGERKAMDRAWLRKQIPQVKLIKLLDRIDNVNEMDGAPVDFVHVYAEETILLAEAIGDADRKLEAELYQAVARMTAKCL